MNTHTKGPWTIHGPCEITGRYSIVHNGPLAYVGDASQLGDGEANARLIASAPELLDALQDIVDAYQKHFDAMPVAWQTYDNIARAAITKATGEQS